MTRKYAKRFTPLLIAILSCLAFSTFALAKGGDTVPPFPNIDGRAGIQYAKAMTVDSSGNIIIAGYKNDSSNNDYMLAKFKADGSGLAWNPVYFDGAGDDVATAVVVDSNNDIIVTGTNWNGVNNDIHTIKYNGATGALIWQDSYNSGGADTATSIAVDASGNIYVAGYAFNGTLRDDFLLIKYSSDGSTPAWVKLYDDTPANMDNRAMAVATGVDGVAVSGYSAKGGADFDILTLKYSFDGTPVKDWRYASAGAGDDRAASVKMDSTGKVIIAGYSTNSGGNSDIYVAKYDPASSTPAWEKFYDGNGSDEGKALTLDSGDNVYISGMTTTLAGNQDFYTARYSASDGTLIWQSIFDAGNGATDIPVGIVVDNGADGGLFVAGYTNLSTNDDYLTVKYNKNNGKLLWEKSWNSPNNNNDRPLGIALDSSRNVVVAGWSYGAVNGYDFAAIKYDFGALNAPSDLVATAASNTSITLTWSDNSTNEDSFIIQRKLGESGTFADITTTPSTLAANTVTYKDSALTANNYYYYRIRAYNGANGDSYYSNEARALTKVVSYDIPVWTYIYNGADNAKDIATAITVGADDHPIVAGYSNLTEEGSEGLSFDYITLKLDRGDQSKIKWKARYDSGSGGSDEAAGVVLDNNGNALVTGTSPQFVETDTSDELYTIKYNTATYSDPTGTVSPEVVWAEQYGTQSGIDKATAIEVVHDASNNSVVIGYGNGSGTSDIFIIKYNADGTRPWTPIVYDSGRNDMPTGLAIDSNGDILVSGFSFDVNDTYALPTGSYDWFVAKYNGTTGQPIWSDTYNVSNIKFGGVNRNDQAMSIDVDASGNAYVSGYATNSDGNTLFYTVKYDGKTVPTTTRRIWEKSFSYAGFDAEAISVKIDPVDGAVVVAGTSYVSATDSDFHLIRYNSLDGSILWERNFDKPDSYDYLGAMTVDSSGYIYLSGDTRGGADTDSAFDYTSDIMSLIYDFEGTFLGASKFSGAAGKGDVALAMTANYQGESFTAGYSVNSSDNEDYVVFKQTNDYILVPAPLTATAQPDYSKIDLSWRENTPGTTFRIERTLGPSTPASVWELIASPASGTTTFTDVGRSASTNYCYRIDASKGSLNSRKIEKCVTAGLPAPVLNVPTVDSATQITLGWGQVANNTGYKIERKITAGGVWAELAIKGAGENSHIDSGLTAGTIYYYRVSAKSVSGYSLQSNEQNAQTLPVAPNMNANGAVTMTTAVINWSNVTGESGYKIERKEGAGGTYTQVGTAGADVLTYSDSGLTFNTQYYYRVRSYNSGGDSNYSGEQGVLTPFTTPTLLSATAVSTAEVDLIWGDIDGETSYTVQESYCGYNTNVNDVTACVAGNLGNSSYWNAWQNIYTTTGPDITSYNRTGRGSGYAYAYRIIANTTGNSSAGSNIIIAWTYMTAPAISSITPVSETALSPVWTNINAATNYTLERKQGTGGTFAEIVGAIGLGSNIITFNDSGLSLSTEYCYRVKAYSTLPNPPPAIYSSEVCATTPLAAPVLNTPTVVSSTQIDLSWSNVPGNSGYEILRCATTYPNNPEYLGYYGNNPSYDSWFWSCSPVITLPQDTVSYSSSGLLPGYTYRHKIRDTYSGGTSAYSTPQDTITIPSAPATISATAVSTTQMKISWSDVNGDAGYKLDWKPRSGADCSAGTWNGPIAIGENVLTYDQTGLTVATYYCYRIKAYNSYNESALSAEISQLTALDPPTLNVPTGVTTSKVDLSWNLITGNSGYLIERKTGAAGTWNQVGSVGQDVVSFSDSNALSAGTLYYYRVKVTNAGGGSSQPSNEQSTTTTPVATSHTVSVISSSQLDIKWNVVLGATNFKVERKSPVDAYTEITNVAADYSQSYCGYAYPTTTCPSLSATVAGYQDSGLAENTNYCYRVKSWNSTGGDSVYSSEQCATTSAMPTQNLSATAVNSAKIRLDWTPVACVPNACDNPDSFTIERQIRHGVWVNMGSVDGTTVSFVDVTGIEPNRQYSYRVKTIKGVDVSPYSNTATVTTPLYSTNPPSCP